ncbi:MAG: aminotransferase class I/II-fold pyridoxal phosphate-dependent enzyme, partial [Chitinophagaceae bacterium]
PTTSGTFRDWSKALVSEINESEENSWVIISNSLNNLYPELYDFSFVEEIRQENKIILIVDDSHGIGIINDGKGVISALRTQKNVDVVIVASMAKALGVDAGLILSSKNIIARLKESNEFLGASPPSAAGLFAFMNASSIYQEEHDKLHEESRIIENHLKGNEGWAFSPGFPVFLALLPNVEEQLKRQRILISSFAYPDKNGSLINRIVLSSWHTHSDIKELILALTKYS